jgi:hypothetical protein
MTQPNQEANIAQTGKELPHHQCPSPASTTYQGWNFKAINFLPRINH